MKIRISEDFKVAYKRLKKRHKSLETDFEQLLASLLQNPYQGVEIGDDARRSVLPSLQRDVVKVEVRVLLYVSDS